MYLIRSFLFILLSICCSKIIAQQPFAEGNFVVYRVGNGSGVLNTRAWPVFIDEYTPNGTLVQSIAMPTEPNGIHNRLTSRGSDVEGFINLSSNGQYLLVTGGNAALGATIGGTAGVIGRIGYDAAINTSTAITDYNVNGPPGFLLRSAASDDGNRFWFGRYYELRYATIGSTTSTPVSSINDYIAAVTIADGQIYLGVENESPRVKRVNGGLVTSGDNSITSLPGFTSASARDPKQFVFADLDPNIPGVDVLYLADLGNSTEGGLYKFSLVGGAWISNGVIGTFADQYMGLAVSVNNNKATLFATRKGNNTGGVRGGELVKIVDNSGYNGAFSATPVVLASVPVSNTISFRGVALVPQKCQPVMTHKVTNITSSQATVSWTSPMIGTSGYEYAITKSEIPPASGTTIANTSVTITGLDNDVTYYAHVRSSCDVNSRSAWSTRSFKTGCNSPVVSSVAVQVTGTGKATLKWKSVFGAVGYEYNLSKNPVPPVAGTYTTDTFLLSDVDAVSNYYLHVRSSCGNAFSPWSTIPFKTNCLLPSPEVTVSNDLSIHWRPIVNATRYEYAVTYANANPPTGVYTSDTVFNIGKVAGNYFHIRAVCIAGAVSDWVTREFHFNGIEAFPNPVGESLNIRLYGATTGKGQIQVADVMGKLIKQIQYTGSPIILDTRSLDRGMYFIRYNDGTIKYSTKVIKQ